MGQQVSQEQGGAPFQQPDVAGPGPAQKTEEQRTEALVVPTVLQWSTGGTSVFVTGSFNNWGERIPLRRSGADYVVCLNLLPGTYQYKFIVDSEWRFAPDQPTVRDEMGNINNCITVEDQQMYLHEDPCSGFFGDNPNNAYTQVLPDEITLAKEPPLAPVHLAVIPLNVSAAPQPSIASWSLQPPLSVTLQHMCVQRTNSPHVTAVSTTQRFRSKYVTIVIYKPRLPASGGAEAADQYSYQQQRDGWMGRGPPQPRGAPQQAAAAAAQAAEQQQQAQQQQAAAQQLAAQQQGRVSWSDGQGQPPPGSELTGGVVFQPQQAYGQQQMLPPHMMPPPPQLPPQMMPAAFAPAPPQLAPAESMDLGSRPGSHATNMDTSGDWQLPDAMKQ